MGQVHYTLCTGKDRIRKIVKHIVHSMNNRHSKEKLKLELVRK
jgi:hypothetical protein